MIDETKNSTSLEWAWCKDQMNKECSGKLHWTPERQRYECDTCNASCIRLAFHFNPRPELAGMPPELLYAASLAEAL